MSVRARQLRLGALAAAAVVAAPALWNTTMNGAVAAGIPANKVAASGSSVERVNAEADTLLLSETVKINNPTDLILSVTAECAILTQVTNSANGQTERAFGEVKIYVTIDGIPVKVAENDADGGKVVFCNRAQEQQWTDNATAADDNEDQLRQYLDTRNANGFNWMALNVGTTYPGVNGDSNVHEIKVWADWDVAATAGALAEAAVGNRTLILEPVKAANREAVTELG